jgi:uncharacterized protein
MQGYQITFFTQQGRKHGHTPLCDWLLGLAKDLDLDGATIVGASKGFGHTGQMHSAGFFDLADQPQLIMMTATAEQAETLLARIRFENLQLFYLKCPAEFGLLGSGT